MGQRLQDGQWSHGWLRANEELTVPRKELEAPWEVIHFWGSTMGRDALVATGGPSGWGAITSVHFPTVHLFPPKCELPEAGAGGTDPWSPGHSKQSQTSRRSQAPLSPPLSPQKEESTLNTRKSTVSGRRQGLVDRISGHRLDRCFLQQDFQGAEKLPSCWRADLRRQTLLPSSGLNCVSTQRSGPATTHPPARAPL